MKIIRRVAAAAVAALVSSAAMASAHEYEVTFYNEPPVKLTVAVPGESAKVGSLKAGSKEAEPKGSVSLRENDASLNIELDWWQGQFDELTDGKGSHLSLPAGVCRKTVTMPLQPGNQVVIPCWNGKHPYVSFDAVTIRRLD
jgi:hypothetical protein